MKILMTMTTEEKAKAYDEAIERAKEMCAMPSDRATMEYVFPELKESEDEKIRKALLNEFTHLLSKGCNKFAGLENEDIITWLEKQGEMGIEMDIEKPITIGKRRAVSGKLKELIDNKDPKSIEETKKKMLEETEPKFKVGDWLINRTNATIVQIVAVTDSFYDYREQSGQRSMSYQEYVEWDFRLWSITDAKDGDVLASSKSIFLFKGIYMASEPEAYCAVMDDFFIKCPVGCWTDEYCHPATKEQRELLFKKMAENGYTWDSATKELSHQEATEKSEQDEPTNWTEDDEKMFTDYSNNVLYLWKKEYAEEFINWIKSLKQRLS